MPPQNPTMLGTSLAMAVSIRVLPSCASTVNSAPCASTKVTLIMSVHIHPWRLSHQTIGFVATTYFAFDTRAATSIRDGPCRTRVSYDQKDVFVISGQAIGPIEVPGPREPYDLGGSEESLERLRGYTREYGDFF